MIAAQSDSFMIPITVRLMLADMLEDMLEDMLADMLEDMLKVLTFKM